MTEHQAIELARSLMHQHGLGPTFKARIDRRASRRAAYCLVALDGSEGVIGLAAWFVRLNSHEQVWNAILHEIAHALTPGHKHDRVWRATAKAIGCDGRRCYQQGPDGIVRPPLAWRGSCPGGHHIERARLPKGRFACAECNPEFREENLIQWQRVK